MVMGSGIFVMFRLQAVLTGRDRGKVGVIMRRLCNFDRTSLN